MRKSMALRIVPAVLALFALAACQDAPADDAANGDAPVPDTVQAGGAAQTDRGLLDPNRATAEELAAVPGVDRGMADSLVARRPFDSMLAVDSVLAGSLSEAEREAVYAQVWMPIDLNSASAEEILLIPGVGERMQHEFEEYRPYRGMAQFRREIGKYVDDAEVARLERYVAIRE